MSGINMMTPSQPAVRPASLAPRICKSEMSQMSSAATRKERNPAERVMPPMVAPSRSAGMK